MRRLPFSKSFSICHTARIHFEDGEAWNACKHSADCGFNDSLLIPSGVDVNAFHWPIQGLHVLLFNTRGQVDQELVKDTMGACLRHGAKAVMALSTHGDLVSFVNGTYR